MTNLNRNQLPSSQLQPFAKYQKISEMEENLIYFISNCCLIKAKVNFGKFWIWVNRLSWNELGLRNVGRFGNSNLSA